MSARSLAIHAFEKLGAQNVSVTLSQEPSDAVALLAACFAKMYQATLFWPEPWGDWPDFFMAPENRINVAQFIRVEVATPAYRKQLAEWDAQKITAWLAYARARIARIERRLAIGVLAGLVVDNPRDGVGLSFAQPMTSGAEAN